MAIPPVTTYFHVILKLSCNILFESVIKNVLICATSRSYTSCSGVHVSSWCTLAVCSTAPSTLHLADCDICSRTFCKSALFYHTRAKLPLTGLSFELLKRDHITVHNVPLCWLALCLGHVNGFRDVFSGGILITSHPFIPSGKMTVTRLSSPSLWYCQLPTCGFAKLFIFMLWGFTHFPAYLKAHLES